MDDHTVDRDRDTIVTRIIIIGNLTKLSIPVLVMYVAESLHYAASDREMPEREERSPLSLDG